MKRLFVLGAVFAISVSTAFAAVDINADAFPPGIIPEGSDAGGAVISGQVSAEAADGTVMKDDGTVYNQVIVLSAGSSLSFDGKSGEVLRIKGAVPADGSGFEMLLSSESSEYVLTGESSDGLSAEVEYVLDEDGSYVLSAPEGSVALYSVTVQ